LENKGLFEFDDFRADVRNRTLTRDGTRVPLPPRVFDALILLLRAAPDAVSREELRAALWGDTVVEEAALAQTVYLARKALGNRPDGNPYIETVPKLGYSFTAGVSAPERAATSSTRSHGLGRRMIAAVVMIVAVAGLAAWELSRSRAHVAPEAERLYRHAMTLWRQRRGFTTTDEQELREAIRIQPNFARAHAGLAAVLSLRDSSAEAKAEVEKALELDPSLADAHAVLGFIRLVHDWDWGAAGAAFESALANEPGNAMAIQWYGMYLALRGRHAEAQQVLQRGVARYPDSMNLLDEQCAALYWAGRFADAARSCGQALTVSPDFLFAREHLALVYAALGRYREAGDMETGSVVGISPAHSRLAGEWQTKFVRAIDKEGARGFYQVFCDAIGGKHWFRMAQCKAGMGEPEAALDWLERGVRSHGFHSVFIVADPLFAGLRSNPRFEDLRRIVGPPR
jgi:DNA-binding winged helix-turn-helix (wHTH) protein/Tfp pilus assembly protein PilF